MRLCSCRVRDIPSWIYSILSYLVYHYQPDGGSSDLRPPTLRVHCGDCGATLPRCRWHRQPGHPTGAVAGAVGKLGCRGVPIPLRLGPLAALQLPRRQFLLREDRLFSTGGDMVGFFYDVPQVTFRLLLIWLIWYRTSILYKSL